MTWPDELRGWTARLAAAGVPSPQADARWLAAHVLGCSVGELGLIPTPDPAALARIDALVARRERREPLQHLIGTAPFLDLELAVGPGVFVPRPETEAMADHAIRWLRSAGSASVVDLGTGSGALALAIACHVPGTSVTAVELSDAALAYARRSAAAAGPRLVSAGSHVEFVQADLTAPGAADSPWAEALAGAVDAVVTNPPYVPDAAVPRDPEVRDHDPRMALFGGADGLDVIRSLLVVAARLLRPGGLLAVEHGDEQGGPDGVPGLVAASELFGDVVDHPDLAGKPRFTTAART